MADNFKNIEYKTLINRGEDGRIKSITQSIGPEKIEMVAVYVTDVYTGPENKLGSLVSENNIVLNNVPEQPFFICDIPITNKIWNIVMEVDRDDNLINHKPVRHLKEGEVQKFLKRLVKKSKLNFRLPCLSEWQFAAKGGAKSCGYRFCGGDNCLDVGWNKYNSGNTTVDVRQKIPNELGLYDMSGNVWELCHKKMEDTRYNNYYEDKRGNRRRICEKDFVVCGGEWQSDINECLPTSTFEFKKYNGILWFGNLFGWWRRFLEWVCRYKHRGFGFRIALSFTKEQLDELKDLADNAAL